jgi:hypothetical protein
MCQTVPFAGKPSLATRSKVTELMSAGLGTTERSISFEG